MPAYNSLELRISYIELDVIKLVLIQKGGGEDKRGGGEDRTGQDRTGQDKTRQDNDGGGG